MLSSPLLDFLAGNGYPLDRVTKNKAMALTALTLLAALAFVTWTLNREKPEPGWNGRPLSAWTEDLATGSSKEIREAAEDAIRHIGTKGIPSLIQMLRARDTFLHRALVVLGRQFNGKQNIALLNITPAQKKYDRAALGFEALGPTARPAIPELKKLLSRHPMPEYVADALSAISPEGVAAILESVPKVAPEKRWALFSSAAKWPAQAPAIIDALLRSIKSRNAEERRCAAAFLGRFKENPATTVPALVWALRDPELTVRMQALVSLTEYGTNAAASVQSLLELSKDKSWLPPAGVSNALVHIRPNSGAVLAQ